MTANGALNKDLDAPSPGDDRAVKNAEANKEIVDGIKNEDAGEKMPEKTLKDKKEDKKAKEAPAAEKAKEAPAALAQVHGGPPAITF